MEESSSDLLSGLLTVQVRDTTLPQKVQRCTHSDLLLTLSLNKIILLCSAAATDGNKLDVLGGQTILQQPMKNQF